MEICEYDKAFDNSKDIIDESLIACYKHSLIVPR